MTVYLSSFSTFPSIGHHWKLLKQELLHSFLLIIALYANKQSNDYNKKIIQDNWKIIITKYEGNFNSSHVENLDMRSQLYVDSNDAYWIKLFVIFSRNVPITRQCFNYEAELSKYCPNNM